MRVKGLLFIAILAGLFILAAVFLTDPWIEKQIEKAGTALVGARVEIDNLDFSLFKMYTRWDSLQVTNPKDTWTNLFATGPCDFDLSFGALLKKKFIIENFQINGLRTGTRRSTDGRVLKKKSVKKSGKPDFITRTAKKLENEVSSAPAWNLKQYTKKVNIDSIIAILDIRAPGKIDSLRREYESRYAFWEQTFRERDVEKELEDIGSLVRSLKIDDIKTLPALQNALITVQQIRVKSDSTYSFIQRTKTGLTRDLQFTGEGVGLVKNWVQNDYERALAKARLPDFSAQNIGKMIFGKKVVNTVNQVLFVADLVRSHCSKAGSAKPEKKESSRLKGQNISFGKKGTLPKFWLKRISLSGETSHRIRLAGELLNLVSDQKLIGEPTTFQIDGTRKDGAQVNLSGEFAYLGGQNAETFLLNFNNVPLSNAKLSDSPFLPYAVKQGVMAVKASLVLGENELTGDIAFRASRLSFVMPENAKSANQLEKIVNTIVGSTSVIDFSSKLRVRDEQTTFTLNSNLDNLFVEKMRSLMSAEINRAKQRLREEVNHRVGGKESDIIDFIQSNNKNFESKITAFQSAFDEKERMIREKKEKIENRIEEEKNKQSNKLEDEAKKKLKDWLK